MASSSSPEISRVQLWGNVGCFSDLISSFLWRLARVHLGHGGPFPGCPAREILREGSHHLWEGTRGLGVGSWFWSRGAMPSGWGVNPSVEHLWSFSPSSPSEGKRGRCARQGQGWIPSFSPSSFTPPSLFLFSLLSFSPVSSPAHPCTHPSTHLT